MLAIAGLPAHVCQGVSRRNVLAAGGAGLLGLSLPKLLAAEEAHGALRPRAKNVIFMLLFGGPSQLETFDMKPDAADKIRGPFQPIDSRTPGLRICQHLPRLAQVSDKFTVVRTMSHDFNDHSGGGHYVQTGRRWQIPIGGGFDATAHDWPSVGSVVEHQAQREPGGLERELPAYAVVPNRLGRLEDRGQYLRPGEYAGWLGRAYNPLSTTIEKRDLADNPYWRDCTDEELNFQIEGLVASPELRLERIGARRTLLDQFDAGRRGLDASGATEAFDKHRRRALALVTSDATREALDIRREPPQLRDQYGRHLFGQATLLARRLVESGVRFVTVHYECVDGYSWDSHLHSHDVRDHLLPTFDQALSALLTDLDDRGLLDETLVLALGEMGRTPLGNPEGGRGHWSTLFPAVLAGGGIARGGLYGTSDKDAAYALERRTSPEDLAATIYTALGIDPEVRLPHPSGRPTPAVEGGQAVTALFA
jgi:hypothetical protein